MKGISAPIFRKEEYGRLKPHLALMQDEIAGCYSGIYYLRRNKGWIIQGVSTQNMLNKRLTNFVRK